MSMDSAHSKPASATPGPWVAKQLAMSDRYVLLWPDKGGHRMRRLDEYGAFTRTDATLAAAALDLFAAAQAAMLCIGELSPTQARVEVAQMLTAALEKAGAKP